MDNGQLKIREACRSEGLHWSGREYNIPRETHPRKKNLKKIIMLNKLKLQMMITRNFSKLFSKQCVSIFLFSCLFIFMETELEAQFPSAAAQDSIRKLSEADYKLMLSKLDIT